MIHNRSQAPVNPYLRAVAYTAARDRKDVLTWLEKSLAERTPDLPEARFEPAFDFVRGDGRFQAVIANELAGEPLALQTWARKQ